MKPVHPLRPMTPEEERLLQRTAKASSERLDRVKRAQAILAIRAGHTYTQAAQEAGYTSGDSVSHLVERFNQQGLAALQIASGRGRKPTYTSDQRACVLDAVQRTPDRERDGTATWSLATLERALRQTVLPQMSATTIADILHDAGYVFGKTRTWCPTGTALRIRKTGIVQVADPKAPEKKD
jgi:transposase